MTRTGNTAAKRGFNLVGNPYPSYLNWEMAYNAANNVRPTIWYRTGSGTSMSFETYNAAVGVSVPTTASGYIPPMQAFWAKVDTDPATNEETSTGILNLTNAMRSHEGETANPLKAPSAKNSERQLIRLAVSNGTVSDEMVIVSHPSASDSFDQYDSEKMSNNDANRPEIYSVVANQELVINGVSEMVDAKEFTLGLRPGKAGNFSIALTEWNSRSDTELVLRDNSKTENRDWILTAENPYSFIVTDAVDNTRFSLIYRSKGSITGLEQVNSKLVVYAIQGKIMLQSTDLTGSGISVTNTMGQTIYQTKAQSNSLSIDQDFATGIYIVKVNNELRKVSVK
jgi:hypothetical protein